ncbi:hypothetical protein ACLB2K_065270 [Fragaria x ananassa]
MQSAAARWREFKSHLKKVYIVPYLEQPEMLKYPPQDYKFINADHWTQFMTERTKPTFLDEQVSPLTVPQILHWVGGRVEGKSRAGTSRVGNGNGGQAGSGPTRLDKPITLVFGQASCSNTADLFENDMHDQVQAPSAQAEIEEVTEKNINCQVEVNGQVEGNNELGVKSILIFKCLIEAMEVNEVAKKKTSTKRRRCEPKSMQPKEVFGQEIEKTEEDVLPKTSDANTQIKRPKVTCEEVPVMLALGSLDNIVATGTTMKIDDPDQLCHGYLLEDQNQPQKQREKRGVPVKIIDLKVDALNAPIQLKMLCMWGADELKNNKSFEFFIEPEVFGYTHKSWIFDLNLHRMASMTEITGNCIMVLLDMITFVDPAMVGEWSGTVRSKAEHLCASQHCVLTVVEPKKENVYYMDPLRRRLHIASTEWKSVINSAIAKYNTENGRPSLNAVAWNNLGGVPHQPDHIQCGFYVMWFMRDIIHDHDHSFVTKWDRRNKLVYT